mgnify:CR=1 FL=1
MSLLAFSSDGRTLTAARRMRKVLRWNVETARLLGPPLLTPVGSALNLHGDTLTTLTTQGRKALATLWNLTSGRQIGTHEVPRAANAARLEP